MNITEIEGLSFNELTDRRDELIAECKKMGVAEVAGRYVQARTDATMRDESMAKQAETLEALKVGLKAADEKAMNSVLKATERVNAADKVNEDLLNKLNDSQAQLDKTATALKEKDAQLATVQAERDKARGLATARRAALADVMNHANSLTQKVAPLLAIEG